MNTTGSAVGVLTIRIFSGRGLSLPTGVALPESVKAAISNSGRHGHQRSASRSNRDSLRRERAGWWLPYVVLEFDKNEILVDGLGGGVDNPQWLYKAHFDVSRSSTLSLSAYLRTSPNPSPSSTKAKPQSFDVHKSDILLSHLTITPSLNPHQPTEAWIPASPPFTGEFHLQISFKPSTPSQQAMTIDSFELLKVIGKGSFGKVMQVKKKDTGRIYALKTIRKHHIASRPGEITHILAERTVLALVDNPFVVPLKFSFQTPDKLYLVMSFVNGGELFYHLQREGKFDVNRSRFYAAELLCALEHLHKFDVVYRDLKPENILLDFTGHIALCDFGLCKLGMSESSKTNTFCGTPEYIAPELLESRGYTKTVDWWTLGVLLYEMMTGLPPFYDENVNTMYQRILHDPLKFPEERNGNGHNGHGEGVTPEAKSIMQGLLQREPTKRLGAGGSEEIKRHPFFARWIDWNKLIHKQITPPFKPSVVSALDVANFDSEFTSEPAEDSVVDRTNGLSETVQRQFEGFTFNDRSEIAGVDY